MTLNNLRQPQNVTANTDHGMGKLTVSKCISERNSQHGEQQPVLGNKSTRETYPDSQIQRKNIRASHKPASKTYTQPLSVNGLPQENRG